MLTAVAVLGGGCNFQSSKNGVAPSLNGGGAASAPSLVGNWLSNTIDGGIPDPHTCGNFQYEIASQTATTVAGTFTGQCGGGLVISGNANGQVNGNAVAISATGSVTGVPGNPSCAFALSANGTLQDNGNTLPLSYVGTTCLGPVHGSETLRRPSSSSTPPPAQNTPAPSPPTPPAPTPSPGDILSGAAVYGGSARDVASWPVTATITGLDFNAGGVRVAFTRKDGPGRWPDVVPPGWGGPLEYTLWMVVNVNGQWQTAGGVEYWNGLERNGGPPSGFAANWYYNPQIWGPLATHQPAVGEQVGFFVTAGDERAKDYTAVRERSNVVVVPFPSDSGAFYPF